MKGFRVVLLGFVLPLLSQSLQPALDPMGRHRRQFLQTLGGGIASAWIGTKTPPAFAASSEAAMAPLTTTLNVAAYQVIPDQGPNLNPTLQSLNPSELVQQLASQGGALWLGEHHNSKKDHALQAQFLTSLQEARQQHDAKNNKTNQAPVAIGLEQVEVQFQPVLDDFSAGLLTTAELRQRVEWDTRWTWPFELYEPIFAKAREYGMPLIALNVNTEDLAFVEQQGLPGLPKDRMRAYISDTTGFASFAATRAFSTYIDYVVSPSYDMHAALGLLRYSRNGQRLEQEMSFRNFLSGVSQICFVSFSFCFFGLFSCTSPLSSESCGTKPWPVEPRRGRPPIPVVCSWAWLGLTMSNFAMEFLDGMRASRRHSSASRKTLP